MSVNPSKSVSYVLSKSVKNYMDNDVVMLGKYTRIDASRRFRLDFSP